MRPSEWRWAFVLAPIYASLIHAHVERWSPLKAHTAFPALLLSAAQHVTLPSTTLSTTAGFPAIKEPQGMLRSDGRRPDGTTLIPWRAGRNLVWNATVIDTIAPSYLQAT